MFYIRVVEGSLDLTADKTEINEGEEVHFTLTLHGYSPNTTVQGYIYVEGAKYPEPISITTNDEGDGVTTFSIQFPEYGTYHVYCKVDDMQSNTVVINVKQVEERPTKPIITDIRPDKSEYNYGETAVITVGYSGSVEGEKPITEDIVLTVNGVEVSRKTVTFVPGKPDTVRFEVKMNEVGDVEICAKAGESQKCTTVTVKMPVEKGFRVLIRDPPPSGKLSVCGHNPMFGWAFLKSYDVSASTTEIYVPITEEWWKAKYDKYRFELYDDTDYLLYSKEVTPPSEGIKEVKLYGWSGCHWRTTIVEAPDKVKSGESFRLKARLFRTPDEPAGEGLTVAFYKEVGGVKKKIGTNVTDKDGYAVITTSETLPEGVDELDVLYYAVYEYEDTYAETTTVTVVKSEAVGVGGWDQFVSTIEDLLKEMGLKVTHEQANAIAMGIVAFVGLMFLKALLK